MKTNLFRTTLVVWTKNDTKDLSVEEIVQQGHVSYNNCREVNYEPHLDPHYDSSDFFENANRNS